MSAPHRRMTLPLRIGTRGSALALTQTAMFVARARALCPALRSEDSVEVTPIRTSGDRHADKRLADIGGKGLFSKEIHEALADGRIDVAVHSLKDLETLLPEGIALAAVLPREDPRDVLILGPGLGKPNGGDPFAVLPQGAMIATGSVRRQAQLLARRPDLETTLIRGNVPTRLERIREGNAHATFLAMAGLKRLGLEKQADYVLPPEVMLPAAGQGIVGVTCRAADTELCDLLKNVEDPAATIAATAERALLAALDGSCRTPIGAFARVDAQGRVRLSGLVARADGTFLLRLEEVAPAADAERLGLELGRALRADAPADLFA